MSPLLSLKFWFSLRPAPLFPSSEFILLAIFALLVVVSIFLKLYSGKKNDLYLAPRIMRLSRMFLTMGIVGLLLLFLSYERAYVIGARFWYLFWGIGFLVWLGFILYDLIKKMPKEKKEVGGKKSFEKYLPQPKKKK